MSNIEIFIKNFINEGGYKLTLEGLLNTALISVFGLLIGLVLGSIISIIKLIPSENRFVKVLKGFCNIYVTVLRGTPIIVQLLICHFALFPLMGFKISGVAEAVIIFGFNSSAYMSETIRGGINAVDLGQTEAGRALGLSFSTTMIRVIMPQAIKNILPMIGNEFISLIKETSVLSFVAVMDLTQSMTAIAASSMEYFVPYIFLAIMYLCLVLMITFVVRKIEKRFKKNER